MALTDTVSRNLKSQRLKRKLSQDALATRTGLSVSMISMLERGQRGATLETLEKMAKALGVRPLSLLEDGGRK